MTYGMQAADHSHDVGFSLTTQGCKEIADNLRSKLRMCRDAILVA